MTKKREISQHNALKAACNYQRESADSHTCAVICLDNKRYDEAIMWQRLGAWEASQARFFMDCAK